MMSPNLWPDDLFVYNIRAPVLILKEQAENLSRMSRRTILGEVVTEKVKKIGSSQDPNVIHYFRLIVPDLGNYTFDLFEAKHKPRSLYPVIVKFNLGNQYDDQNIFTASDEEELGTVLLDIFQHDDTAQVIRTLKAQVDDPAARPPEGSEEEPPGDDDIPF